MTAFLTAATAPPAVTAFLTAATEPPAVTAFLTAAERFAAAAVSAPLCGVAWPAAHPLQARLPSSCL